MYVCLLAHSRPQLFPVTLSLARIKPGQIWAQSVRFRLRWLFYYTLVDCGKISKLPLGQALVCLLVCLQRNSKSYRQIFDEICQEMSTMVQRTDNLILGVIWFTIQIQEFLKDSFIIALWYWYWYVILKVLGTGWGIHSPNALFV